MYTVDTSVWVNSFDQREPGHTLSRQVLQILGGRAIPIVVPHLLLVEVAAAISRTRQDPTQAQTFAAALRELPNVTFIALDEKVAVQALTIAAEYGLRCADAVYAAVALEAGCALISLDNEHLTRLKRIIQVHTPNDILPDLLSI
jgi:predicted nucleic acid-binding protein